MKKTVVRFVSLLLAGCMVFSISAMAAGAEKSTYLEFSSEEAVVTDGRIDWNEETGEWKATMPSAYGEVTLSGTFAEDGTLEVTEDSTGGYATADLPIIQEVFSEAFAGRKNAPLSFSSPEAEVAGGKLEWDESAGTWTATMPSAYGEVVLSGTFTEDGTMEVTEDSTGGYATADLPLIQEVFTAALAGEYQKSTSGEDVQFTEEVKSLPGNAEEYTFDVLETLENSPLAGKEVCILGSSVVFGAKSLGYAVGEYLAKRFGFTLTKEALSATTLAEVKDNSYVQRMKENLDPEAHFDLFICQLSTNDATEEVPLGEISESMDGNDFDTSTIIGAMEYIIWYVNETWGCPVVFFTGSYYDSEPYADMVAVVKQLSDKWGIGVLDLYTGEEFNSISEEERSLYMNDDIHPTMAGYRDWWGPELEKQLLDFLAE